MDANDQQLLSSRDLGALLGVSKRSVNLWTQRGSIPALWCGATALYVVDDVRAALADAGWRGNQKTRRRTEDPKVRACGACRRPFPRDHYPPSAGRSGGWCCRDCRRPSKRASDLRRGRARLSTQVIPVDIRIVAERDGWRCGICRRKVRRETWSLDHVVPLSLGGAHTYTNVVLAHRLCNSRRGVGRLPVQASLFGALEATP